MENMSAKTKINLGPVEQENARLRGDLLTIGSRVSHDLLTPLGGIYVSVQLLKETLPNAGPSGSLGIDSLLSSADEIKHILESVSVLAKATARPLPKQTVPMQEIISAVMDKLESRISRRGAKVTVSDSWPEVEAVPAWVEFIWRSLLSNALQHGGLNIELGWARDKKEFRFFVSDNGPGIPREMRPQLFQTFDSLQGLDSRRGLGLSVVQRLADLQGGRCDYDHTAEDHPRFSFTLPMNPG